MVLGTPSIGSICVLVRSRDVMTLRPAAEVRAGAVQQG